MTKIIMSTCDVMFTNLIMNHVHYKIYHKIAQALARYNSVYIQNVLSIKTTRVFATSLFVEDVISLCLPQGAS
jgi:hypothetical protein